MGYSFHPLAGQTVVVVGDTEFAGIRHLMIRRADGTAFNIPAWMVGPEAATMKVVGIPRLRFDRLIELREFVDGLMASSSGEPVPLGEQSHEDVEDTTTRYVCATTAGRQADARPAGCRGEAARGTAEGGNGRAPDARQRKRRAGGAR